MARIRECDRCKCCYDNYTNDYNSVGTAVYNMDNESVGNTVFYDLCPKCQREFKSWLFEFSGTKSTFAKDIIDILEDDMK